MAYEALDWVWTPDETTNFNYTGNLATMASSIEHKVGRFVYEAEGVAEITDSTNFGPYTPGNVLRVVRQGKFVSLIGTWACNTPNYLQTLSNRSFARLPVGFRPSTGQVLHIMQGSSTTHYQLVIGTDGIVSAARASASHGTNFWMPINIVFLAED